VTSCITYYLNIPTEISWSMDMPFAEIWLSIFFYILQPAIHYSTYFMLFRIEFLLQSIQTDSQKHLSLLFCIITQISYDTCWNLSFPHQRIDDQIKEKQKGMRGRLPIYIINHDTSTLTKAFFWSICHPIYSFHHLSTLRNFAISRNQISNLGNILFLVILIPQVLLNFCC